jgi:hypothetical protein
MSIGGGPEVPRAPGPRPEPPPRSRRATISRLAFAAGGLVLTFVVGAAAMFFQLPPADFMAKAFAGGRAWFDRAAATRAEPEPELHAALVDRPGRTFDGFTLCTFAAVGGSNTEAYLVDMGGQMRHRWATRFSRVWTDPPHVQGTVADDMVCFFNCHLFPNGDLLAVLHGVQQQAVGYGLIKLDKDSNLLWSYAANVHHDVDVAPDGTVYAIRHTLESRMPDGLGFIPTPCLVDALITLAPDGRPVGRPLPLLEALRDSPYAALLSSLEPGPRRAERATQPTGPRFDELTLREDPLHANSVRVLTPALAAKFPGWKAGHLLVSMRNIDALAVVDPERRAVVWAARGPWQAQHDAQFLDDGNLLLFDNRGLPKGSRVLEYDPRTQAFPWAYAGEHWGPFYSAERGQCQRLPNGNTLAVNSEAGEIVEVTRDKEVVWALAPHRYVPHARRYAPSQVPFVAGGPRP